MKISPSRAGKGTGMRPWTWITGPDELLHEQYYAFLKQRAQARFRREAWNLSFEQFHQIWAQDWHRRGRASSDMCMTRDDYDLPWDLSNVTIVPRHEHVRRSWVVKMARGQTGPKHKRKPPQ